MILLTISAISFLFYFALLIGFMWFLESNESSVTITFEDVIKSNWAYLLLALLIYIAGVWNWVWRTEEFWRSLIKEYSNKFDLDPAHIGYTFIPGLIFLDKKSHMVWISATVPGIIVDRKKNGVVYIPWSIVKSLTVINNEATINLNLPESLGREITITWHDKFNAWVPDSLNKLLNSKDGANNAMKGTTQKSGGPLA